MQGALDGDGDGDGLTYCLSDRLNLMDSWHRQLGIPSCIQHIVRVRFQHFPSAAAHIDIFNLDMFCANLSDDSIGSGWLANSGKWSIMHEYE